MGARRTPGPNPFQGNNEQFGYRTVSPDELEGMFGDSAPFSDFFQQFFGGGAGARPGSAAGRSRRRVARRGAGRRGRCRDQPRGCVLGLDAHRRPQLGRWSTPGRGEDPGGDPRGRADSRRRPGGRGSRTAGREVTSSSASTSGRTRPSRVTATISASACRRRSPPRSPVAPWRVPTLRGTTAQLSIPRRNAERRPAPASGPRDAPSQGRRRRRPARHRRRPAAAPDARGPARLGAVRADRPPPDAVALGDRERVLAGAPSDRADVALAGRRDDVDGENATARACPGAPRRVTGKPSSAQDRGPAPRSVCGSALTLTCTGGPCWRSRSRAARSTSAREHERSARASGERGAGRL